MKFYSFTRLIIRFLLVIVNGASKAFATYQTLPKRNQTRLLLLASSLR